VPADPLARARNRRYFFGRPVREVACVLSVDRMDS
jgi:hypothetical protein